MSDFCISMDRNMRYATTSINRDLCPRKIIFPLQRHYAFLRVYALNPVVTEFGFLRKLCFSHETAI